VGGARASTCPPAPSNLPTNTEAAIELCGDDMRSEAAAGASPASSIAGAASTLPLAAKKATPATPAPALTAAVSCSVYSVLGACARARALVGAGRRPCMRLAGVHDCRHTEATPGSRIPLSRTLQADSLPAAAACTGAAAIAVPCLPGAAALQPTKGRATAVRWYTYALVDALSCSMRTPPSGCAAARPPAAGAPKRPVRLWRQPVSPADAGCARRTRRSGRRSPHASRGLSRRARRHRPRWRPGPGSGQGRRRAGGAARLA